MMVFIIHQFTPEVPPRVNAISQRIGLLPSEPILIQWRMGVAYKNAGRFSNNEEKAPRDNNSQYSYFYQLCINQFPVLQLLWNCFHCQIISVVNLMSFGYFCCRWKDMFISHSCKGIHFVAAKCLQDIFQIFSYYKRATLSILYTAFGYFHASSLNFVSSCLL